MIEKTRVNNIITWRLPSNIKPKPLVIAEFEFFEENDKIWLNNCLVDEEYRRTGIGKSIILNAIEEFGAVFFSRAEKGEHKRKGLENDTRYIEPPDGENFVTALLEEGIIKSEWVINPFENSWD